MTAKTLAAHFTASTNTTNPKLSSFDSQLMADKILISIRLDKDIVDLFDRLAHNNRGWSRSALINEVLKYVIHAATEWDIMRMARKFPKKEANFTDLVH